MISFRCLCDDATRLEAIERGLALHVDGCPLPARFWRGKPYANIIHDCFCCEFIVGIIHDDIPGGEGSRTLLCGGFKAAKSKGKPA